MVSKLLTQQLASVRRLCTYRRLAEAAGLSLFLPGVFCCILNLWEALAGFQESAAALLTAASLPAAAGLLILLLGAARRKSGDLLKMAAAVEQHRPEFRDAYYAAVELEGKASPLRPMEELLLEQMQARCGAEDDFLKKIFAARLSWRKAVLIWLGVLAVWGIAGAAGNILPKTWYYWRNLGTGKGPGLRIHELQKEYPVRSDIRIAVDILRWEKQAFIELRDARTGRQRLPMTDSPAGTSVFTVYELEQDCEFRICTPSLRSPWQSIRVYVQPSADSIQLKAVPPAYTRRPSAVWSGLQDLELIAGSELELQARTGGGIAAVLEGGGAGPLESREAPHRFRMTVRRNMELGLCLRDSAGHIVRYPSFQVKVLPDLPPVVEVRSPGPDAVVRRGDSVRLEFFAGDDFGIGHARLRFTVSGSSRKIVDLLHSEPGKENPEEEVVYRWNLPEHAVKDGDLLSCFIEVADNRQPEPQWTRSDIFFLTVRPDGESLEDSPQKGQDSGQKFDVSDLITENKRLLRLSLDSMSGGLQDRKRGQFELHRSLNELSLEVIRRLNRLVEMSLGRPQPGLPELFRLSSEELKKAARFADSMLFEESLQPEEISLTALIRIENELIKNSMRNKKGQGKKSSEQKQSGDQAQQKKEEKQGMSAAEKLSRMRKMQDELKDIAAAQQKYNDRCRNSEALPERLAAEQKQIQERTGRAEAGLKKIPEAARSARHLEHGAQEMMHGAQAMQAGQTGTGEIHGARALRYVQSAIRSLESAVRKAAAGRVEQLAQAAGQLADRQAREARESGQAADGKDAAAAREKRNRQKQLSAMTRALKQEVQEAAAMLEKDFPEVAQEIRRQSAESTKRGLEKAQKRAENGLLYRRFKAAGQAQQQAADLLRSLAQGLHAGAGRMPPVSSDELRDALEQLQKQADRVSGEMKGRQDGGNARRIQARKKESGEMLQRLAEALRDGGLMEISEMLTGPENDGLTPEQAGARGLELFRASAEILLRHLQKMEMDEKIRLNRRQIQPPEKYRRQVQEYFRNLGEEK